MDFAGATDDEAGPLKARHSSTPKRALAIKRHSNATPQRKVSATKASTPNSAPVRGKSGSKRPEPTLLGDFLLGRPSPSRVRRRSSDIVKAEVKVSAVNKSHSPGSVKDRVRQWQKSNAAAAVVDHNSPASEPDEVMVAVDAESVNEEDRIRIKRRLGRHDRQKYGENKDKSPDPENNRLTPKKRVVSDEHWMSQTTNGQRRKTSAKVKSPPEAASTPNDFPETRSTDPPPKRKIEGRTNRSSTADRKPEYKGNEKDGNYGLADDGIRVKPLPDNFLDDETRVTPRGGQERQKHTGNDEPKDRYSTRRKTVKISPELPKYQALWRNSNCSNDVRYENDDAQSAATGSRRRPGSLTPPESLADIPVGYSAFSVLDIPVGGDASRMRQNKPQRNPSLSSVPKVLKKVYHEGMKIVHDTVEPPRVDLHEPPSIESWLSGTSDPFIDNVLPIKPIAGGSIPKPARPGFETSKLYETAEKVSHHTEDPNITTKQRRRIPRPNPRTEDTSTPLKDDGSHESLNIDMTGYIDEAYRDLPTPSPPSGLKRSPATRNISSKSSPKTPLREVLADAFRGESETYRTKQSSTESPIQQKSRKASGLKASKADSSALLGDSYDKQDESQLRQKQPLPDINTRNTPDSSSANRDYASSRREAPQTGKHQLYTIASVETFSTVLSQTNSNDTQLQAAVAQNKMNGSTISHTTAAKKPPVSQSYDNRAGLKRRLTKHSDLLSILSMPENDAPGRNRSIRSARSVRTTRSRLSTATISDILQELADDEAKYMRELKTLVDGVIPVLLTSVVKKSESSATRGIFGSSSRNNTDSSMTKPIVDMGVALERLKSLHKRIPLEDPNQLLHWASGACKIYQDYLAAWRMGFQDVVVNLASATHPMDTDSLLDTGMPRNADGDVINGDGERVDVAFLLKRPLVRIKYLAKATKGIRTLRPSQQSEKVDDQFQDLLELTRRRTKEEAARQEDQLASNTDSTRARDPKTLAAIEGVKIDQTRQVRAKDYFSLDLSHSNGQRLGCEVELLLRDKLKDPGDVLICEVDARKDRWLLFPPIDFDQISAREGSNKKELVVMIRGIGWREIFTLTADGEETAAEWIQMLGETPRPPSLNVDSRSETSSSELQNSLQSTDFLMSGGLGADAVEVPIGEKRRTDEDLHSPISRHRRHRTASRVSSSLNTSDHVLEDPRSTNFNQENLKEMRNFHKDRGSEPGRRKDHQHYSSQGVETSISQLPKEMSRKEQSPTDRHSSKHVSAYNRGRDEAKGNESSADPAVHRSYKLDLPSAELPIRPREEKVSYSSNTDERRSSPLKESMRPDMPFKERDASPQSKSLSTGKEDGAPVPPAHKSSSPPSLKKTPILSSLTPKSKNRRSSSPLKHEYQPSDASGTSSASEYSDSDGQNASPSDSSDDEELEGIEFSASSPGIMRHIPGSVLPSGSSQSLANASLATSSSASHILNQETSSRSNPDDVKLFAAISSWSQQGRWDTLHPEDCSIVIGPGLIEAFAMPADHLESRRRNAAADQPLVALVLTPVVPLRQSTALDIEIRSPPLSSSKLKCGDTVRFRTRTVEDCRALYAAIHRARLDNPKYKQLEQERILNSYGGKSYQAAVAGNRRRSWFGRQKSYRATVRAPSATASEDSTNSFTSAISALKRLSTGGAFNIEKSSIDTAPGESLGTRSGGTSVYTSSSDSGTSGFTPPRTPTGLSTATAGNQNGETFGHDNLKIRLYILETSSKWNEIGAARLTVTHPPIGLRSISALDQGMEKRIIIKTKPGDKQQKLSKRYSVSKPEEEEGEKLLLDIILGARSFSRQGIVGVCMNVWEEIMGDNGELGTVRAFGGVSGRTKKYMFQCANAAQARWIFALVGNGGR